MAIELTAPMCFRSKEHAEQTVVEVLLDKFPGQEFRVEPRSASSDSWRLHRRHPQLSPKNTWVVVTVEECLRLRLPAEGHRVEKKTNFSS